MEDLPLDSIANGIARRVRNGILEDEVLCELDTNATAHLRADLLREILNYAMETTRLLKQLDAGPQTNDRAASLTESRSRYKRLREDESRFAYITFDENLYAIVKPLALYLYFLHLQWL